MNHKALCKPLYSYCCEFPGENVETVINDIIEEGRETGVHVMMNVREFSHVLWECPCSLLYTMK